MCKILHVHVKDPKRLRNHSSKLIEGEHVNVDHKVVVSILKGSLKLYGNCALNVDYTNYYKFSNVQMYVDGI